VSSAELSRVNEINVGEALYIIARTRSLAQAEDFLHRFAMLPITPVCNAFADVLAAARVKAQFPLSYADAFAISTAMRSHATVVTGDLEFHAVAHLVEILWL